MRHNIKTLQTLNEIKNWKPNITSTMDKINVIREIRELKTHLSYSKNIGFFFGAGTSCASCNP